jgi:hypothetical protein
MGLEERVRLGHFASYGERVICMTLSGSKLTAVLVNEPKSPSRCELVAEIANLARESARAIIGFANRWSGTPFYWNQTRAERQEVF